MEIADNTIVEVACQKEEKKQCFIEQAKKQLEASKKKIDFIDIERLESSLNVRNYLVFFTMITGIYHERSVDDLTQLSNQMGIKNLLDREMNSLSRAEKIKVRCLASYLKKINCLVSKDILLDLEPAQKESIIGFLKKYFRREDCFCLLFESDYSDCEKVDKTYKI